MSKFYKIALLNPSNSRVLVLKSVSDLAVACYRSVFIAGTKLNNQFVLRACLINHRKQKSSVEFLLDTIRRVAATIK